MKKILLLIVTLIGIGGYSYAQSPQRFVNLTPAYPIAIGETRTDNLVYTNSGIYIHDIVQDSLPVYEIGYIDAQTVRFNESGHGFYVKADSLHSTHVVYSMEVDSLPRGPIDFYPNTGRFKYYPAADDYRMFYVTFYATDGTDTISERVKFSLIPRQVPESFAFQSQGTLPNGMDYTVIAERADSMFLNNMERKVYSYSISGKDIVFDNNVENKVWGLSGRSDIYELNIFAERLIVRSALTFPQTNITIYAKEIVFEDRGSEIASINTSPSSLGLLTDGAGENGGNAGNITLYIKHFNGNLAKRLILNGAKGQSTSRNGQPGNGGNGGVVTCNLDIRPYCDFTRGSCGVKYDVDSNSTTLLGQIIGSGATGASGHFVLDNTPYAYLHPYYVQAALRYINDAFINNYTDYVASTCREYRNEISSYIDYYDCDTCYSDHLMQLSNNLNEINDVLSKVEMGLDYFGNPIGWVPLLSFEVMVENFNNEIARAIPTLYMYYWLNRIDMTLQRLVAANDFAASTTESELQELQNALNMLVAEIPILQNEAAEVQHRIDEVQEKIDRLRDQLMKKARHKVKSVNRIKKAVSICKGVANVLPMVGPWGTAIGTGINTVLNSGVLDGLTQLGIDCISPLDSMAINADSHMIDSVQSQLSRALGAIGDFDRHGISKSFKDLEKTTKPLVDNIKELSNTLSHGSTPKNQVEAVFNQLCASSPEWKSLQSDMDSLMVCKINLMNHILQNINNIKTTLSGISGDLLALDAFRYNAFNSNSKRDIGAMQYIERMEQRAKFRLLKYHYYMRKAYEYRLLKPFEGEFNLVGMFERLEELGYTFDSVVSQEAYTSLSSIFHGVISSIAEEIIDEYANNYPEQSVSVIIKIPHDQLDIINANNNFALNFYEMGTFSPDEENVRIVDLGIHHIETHVEGDVGNSGYMDLNLTHCGISRLRKDGQVYWFDHMSRTTTTPHTWGIRYDAISQESSNIQPSAASASLLSTLINSSGNIMLFSRPSAWGDIVVTKNVHTQGGGNIIIDSLVLLLRYDFVRRPSDIRNIDITANEGLMPHIACSETDINGRSDGNGDLNRSYATSHQPVTFTAIEQYGNWYFVNWTNRAGDTVSDSPELTVTRATDQFYRANYERRVPILKVSDTIYVGHDGGIRSVVVKNVGSDDIAMDWYVSDSLSSWVRLTGIAGGVDSGTFSFFYDSDDNGADRVDSLEIYAPETDIISKTIYVVQTNRNVGLQPTFDNAVHVYPNPVTHHVTVEGEQLASIRVFSMLGQELAHYQTNGSNCFSIEVSSLSDGIYLLSIETAHGTTLRKLIKTSR